MSNKNEKTDTYEVPQDLAKALHKLMVKALSSKGAQAAQDIVNDIADPNDIAQAPKKEIPITQPGVMYKGSKVKEFLKKKAIKKSENR